ncbi:VanZ family protein [Clostridium thermarum]
MYILLVLAITLLPINFMFKLDFNRIRYNLIPFEFFSNGIDKLRVLCENGRSLNQALIIVLTEIIKSFGYNIILFIPMGLFFPLIYEKKYNIKKIILTSLFLSICIEIFQVIEMVLTFTSWRTFDIDDIIANAIGGGVGFLCYKFLLYCKNSLTKILKNKKSTMLSIFFDLY